MFRSAMHQTKQRQQLCPRPIPLIHRIGVPASILLQAFIQPGDGIVLEVHLIIRHQAAIFGIEQEHQPQQHGQQAEVDLVGVVTQQFLQQLSFR
ncbi:MAG: hypothetical protein QM703_07380 [Gemmatales bacterium]